MNRFYSYLVALLFVAASSTIYVENSEAQRRCRAEKREVTQANKLLRKRTNNLNKALRRVDTQYNRLQRVQLTADRAIQRATDSCARKDSSLALKIDRLESNRTAKIAEHAALMAQRVITCLIDPAACRRIDKQISKLIRIIARSENQIHKARAQRDRNTERCNSQLARLSSVHTNKLARAEANYNRALEPVANLEQLVAAAQARFDQAEAAYQACLGEE